MTARNSANTKEPGNRCQRSLTESNWSYEMKKLMKTKFAAAALVFGAAMGFAATASAMRVDEISCWKGCMSGGWHPEVCQAWCTP